MKENAIPTKFSHNQPPKRSFSSITNNSMKKTILEDIFLKVYHIQMNKKMSYPSCQKISIMRSNAIKTKSIRTQYKVSHFGKINKRKKENENVCIIKEKTNCVTL